MTSLSIVVDENDASRFVAMENHAACLSTVGETSDFEDAEAGVLRISPGPFIKPGVVGNEVPLNYLIIGTFPAIFDGIPNADN